MFIECRKCGSWWRRDSLASTLTCTQHETPILLIVRVLDSETRTNELFVTKAARVFARQRWTKSCERSAQCMSVNPKETKA